MKPLLLLFLSCALLSCSSGNDQKIAAHDSLPQPVTPSTFDPASMHASVRQLETLHGGLIARGSVDSLKAMYSDDARLCPEAGTFITGADAIADYWKAFDGVNFIQRNSISLDGDKNVLYETGIETGSLQKTATHDKKDWNYKYITVWKKQPDGSWQIVLESWNTIE